MTHTVASIDVGSHTARLLIARRASPPFHGWRPLIRQRAYLRLAADFDAGKRGELGPEALERVVGVLHRFAGLMSGASVDRVHAVATGVIREAVNRDLFLSRIEEATGIHVEVISGEQEACLSGRGAVAALNISAPYVVFDLGGGTTEFLEDTGDGARPCSLPLGAAMLTKQFFTSDPPTEEALNAVSTEVHMRLTQAIQKGGGATVIGTGGTATTLAAMVSGMSMEAITPDTLNGRVLTIYQLEACLGQMKCLSSAMRVARLGIDPGRADVIVAGTLAVIGILRFLEVREMTVSLSDLLEGLLQIEDEISNLKNGVSK